MENVKQSKTRMALAVFGPVERKVDFSLEIGKLFKSFEELFVTYRCKLEHYRIDLPVCRKDRNRGEYVQAAIAVESTDAELTNKLYTKFANAYNDDLSKLKEKGIVNSYSFISEVVDSQNLHSVI